MKRTATAFAVILAAAISTAVCARAQSLVGDATENELQAFDQNFLDSHYEVAQDLRRDPSLIGGRKYLKDHPGLQKYLVGHPLVRQHIHDHPKDFVQREEWFRDAGGLPRSGRTWTQWERLRAQGPGIATEKASAP